MRLFGRLITVVALVVSFPVVGSAQDQFFDSNGVRMRYVEQGTGDVVVLIHGNGGSLQGWIDRGVLPTLARDYRVVAIDARGHGKSGKPHDPRAYGREMGLDVIRLLDHLKVRRAHIIGYSMGASITATLLTSHPDRFITATLGGAAGRFRWTAEDTSRAMQEASEKERDCVSKTQIRRLTAVGQPKPSDEEIRKASEACMANPNQDRFALAALHRSLPEQAITPEQVKAVKVPTLGVVGSLDPYLADFKELATLRPAMKLVVIDGATHGNATQRPEFVAAVREFLKSNTAKDAAPVSQSR
jgi:pimeloyl-ACP methyl ester carboxylesterase